MKQLVRHYSAIASTLALFVALTGAGAYATGLISGKQIRNNSINAKKVKFPRAHAVTPAGARSAKIRAHASVGTTYEEVADMGTYEKLDATSTLQVTWAGTAKAGTSACIFQLRVDGQPPDGGGAEVYVESVPTSVSDQALFSRLSAGTHHLQIYARNVNTVGFPCVVGPPEAQIAQTVNAVELVN